MKKKLILFYVFLQFILPAQAQNDSIRRVELEKIKQEIEARNVTLKYLEEERRKINIKNELNRIKIVSDSLTADVEKLKNDEENKRDKIAFHTLTDFRIMAIPTDFVEDTIQYQDNRYAWRLYFYAKGNEPMIMVCKLLQHTLHVKKPYTEYDKEIVLIFGHQIRKFLEKEKNKTILKEKISKLFLEKLTKCHQIKSCKECWFLPVCCP